MARTQLLTNDEVREYAIAKSSFDSDKFKPHIIPAQLEFIKPFLGKDLFDELIEETEAEDISTANETLLNDYIKPALAWFVVHKTLPFLHADISNVGVQINSTEYSNSGTDKQRADLSSVCLDNGNAILEACKEYLEDNEGTYPLYDNADDIEDSQEIIGGIILDND